MVGLTRTGLSKIARHGPITRDGCRHVNMKCHATTLNLILSPFEYTCEVFFFGSALIDA